MVELTLFEKQMKRQFEWTKSIRTKLFDRANMRSRRDILDIGCGIGVTANELQELSQNKVTGVDINPENIARAKAGYPEVEFQCANALDLPFEDESFDLITTSWFWLWIQEKETLAKEIKRLLRPGGVYISIVDVDYEARLDYPEEMAKKKQLIIDIITREGGDPFAARKLRALFSDDTLDVSTGVFGTVFDDEQLKDEGVLDWQQIKGFLKPHDDLISEQELNRLQELEDAAVKNKTRFTFMPLFWLYVVKREL